MNSRDFFDKVALMRQLQKEYFKTRSKSVLEQCKVVEKEVDVEIKRVNAVSYTHLTLPTTERV